VPPSRLRGAVEPQQGEQVVQDALAIVLETELADTQDGDPVALQPRVSAESRSRSAGSM
jgi:hypothetical protein